VNTDFDLIAQICERHGLEPNHVRSLTVDTRHIEFEVFKLNDNGKKYIDHDTGMVALYRVIEFYPRENLEVRS